MGNIPTGELFNYEPILLGVPAVPAVDAPRNSVALCCPESLLPAEKPPWIAYCDELPG
jgi:hypothetical protein